MKRAREKEIVCRSWDFFLIAVAVLVGLPNGEQRRLRAPERKQWKEQAIGLILAGSRDQQMISNEITALHMEASNQTGDGWIGTNVLLMTNGEYMVYSQLCSKQNPRIHDIFIAHGSDGRWYYSTFHFCVGMLVATTMDVNGPPGSIAEFSRKYSAHEFDGRSDECLKKTWPFKGGRRISIPRAKE